MTPVLCTLALAYAGLCAFVRYHPISLDELETDLERRIAEPEEDGDIANDNGGEAA